MPLPSSKEAQTFSYILTTKTQNVGGFQDECAQFQTWDPTSPAALKGFLNRKNSILSPEPKNNILSDSYNSALANIKGLLLNGFRCFSPEQKKQPRGKTGVSIFS